MSAWLMLGLVMLLGAAAPAAAEEARITVKKFRVAGNTLLSEAEVRGALDPYVGKALNLAEIKQAARKLRAAYRARGFVMAHAFVPPQEFRDDTVEIRVQEGKFGAVKVEGNQHYSDEFIRRFFSPAQESPVLQQESLQRALLVLNQNLDLRVQSVLEAKKDGTVDVTLKAKDERPLHFILDYDNFGVRLVGKNRVGAGVIAGNTLLEGDVLALKVVHPFNVDEAEPFYFANYSIPVGEMGSRIEGSFAKATTFVGQELADLGIQGDATIYTLRGSIPDDITLEENSAFFVEVVAKDIKNSALDGALLVSNDQVRTLSGGHRGTRYTGQGRTQIAHTAQAIVGLGSALGGSEATDATSRVGADNEFARATAEIVAIHKISDQGFVLGRFVGQIATSGLMVPEQFALGGPDNVRGFQQGEFLGDLGYAATLEYRHTVMHGRQSSLQALAFLDHGAARLKDPLSGEVSEQDLTGAGIGMRGQFGKHVSARVDFGFCVDPSTNVDGDKNKIHAQVSSRF